MERKKKIKKLSTHLSDQEMDPVGRLYELVCAHEEWKSGKSDGD